MPCGWVGHVNIRVADPRLLLSLLTGRLRLPALWPVTALPGFEIGGDAVGNVHLKPTRYGRSARRRGAGRSRVIGFDQRRQDWVYARNNIEFPAALR